MAHIMLDLETMGSSKRAAITQIGAVRFVPTGAPLPEEPQRDSPVYLLINVDLASSMAAGLEVDADTIYFWLGHRWVKEELRECANEDARLSLFNPRPIPLQAALKRLKAFVTDWRNDYVWGKGSDFDNAVISESFRAVGDRFGLNSFGNNRCVRTIMDDANVKDDDVPRAGQVHHNAADDAWHQARVVQLCYSRLGKGLLDGASKA